jgi:transmembrane sensor
MGFDAWSDLDERKSLAKLRAGMSQLPDRSGWQRLFAPVDWSDTQARRSALAWMRLRFAVAGAALGALAVMAVLSVNRSDTDQVPSTTTTADRTSPPSDSARVKPVHALRLIDGSTVDTDAESTVVVERVAEKKVAVRLKEGKARFSVTPNPARTFEVRVDDLVVKVLGTKFVVDRRATGVAVKVFDGLVHVSWPNGLVELRADEETEVSYDEIRHKAEPEEDHATRAPSESQERDEPTKRGRRPRKVREPDVPPAAGTWQSLALKGQHEDAYSALRQTKQPVSNTVRELLLAADAARFSGHSADAVAYLQRVLDEHASDGRAPMAAFTLGTMYLRYLNEPRKAAGLFQRARELAPTGPLAGDALAREVQSWAEAGDTQKARALAEQYLEKYPNGPRARSVRHHGGLSK